jgi:hypothetical protein
MPQTIDAMPINAPRDQPETSVQDTRKRLQRLAHVLDSAIPLPGSHRIGLDGFIGLIPGIGDITGAGFSSYIIAEAYRLGTPTVVLLRMVLNMLVESLVGVIPIVGDLFDFAWKANRRNVQLLERQLEQPHAVRRQSQWVVAGVATLLVGTVALALVLVIALLRWLIAAL